MVAEDVRQYVDQRARPLRRAEYETLVGVGAFEGEHVELVRGVVLSMSPIDPPHAKSVDVLNRLLTKTVPDTVWVRIQHPFAATDDSAPQPDVALVPDGDYGKAHPSRAYLVIEVAASSLRFDRTVKAGVYAEAGVPDYWVVNLVDGQIEVHREPTPRGYRVVTTYRRGERVALLAFPDVTIAVDDVVPA
jgi:Uma2 family endonuclease